MKLHGKTGSYRNTDYYHCAYQTLFAIYNFLRFKRIEIFGDRQKACHGHVEFWRVYPIHSRKYSPRPL